MASCRSRKSLPCSFSMGLDWLRVLGKVADQRLSRLRQPCAPHGLPGISQGVHGVRHSASHSPLPSESFGGTRCRRMRSCSMVLGFPQQSDDMSYRRATGMIIETARVEPVAPLRSAAAPGCRQVSGYHPSAGSHSANADAIAVSQFSTGQPRLFHGSALLLPIPPIVGAWYPLNST
jgi:hypothetical protein